MLCICGCIYKNDTPELVFSYLKADDGFRLASSGIGPDGVKSNRVIERTGLPYNSGAHFYLIRNQRPAFIIEIYYQKFDDIK